MDYRFRDAGHRYPPFPAPLPPFFPEHAFHGGYPVGDPSLCPDIMRGPGCDYYDPMQREFEKEQIRKEMIAEDMARRRMLEAEVRREMMMEKEMDMRACMPHGGLSFEDRLTMQLDRRADFVSRNHRPHHEGFGFAGGRRVGLLDRMLLPRGASLPKASEARGAGAESDKNKLIVLPKPKPNLSGEKRKTEISLSTGASDLSSLLKKKPKEEWSCALCQVTATSEQGLNEHLMGKKHINNEARLRAEKTGKYASKMSKKTARFTKSRETSTLIAKGEEPDVDGESTQPDESGNGSLNRVDVTNNSGDGKQLIRKDQDEKEPKETKALAQDEKQKKITRPQSKKRKFKFWCEMCKVGAFSATVMESHEKGKKHMSQLEEVKQGKIAISAATTGSLVVIEKTTFAEATTENLVAVVNEESEASVPESTTVNLDAIKMESDADMLAEVDMETISTIAAE